MKKYSVSYGMLFRTFPLDVENLKLRVWNVE
jgi:hypothetical protein